jgi:hemerythrin
MHSRLLFADCRLGHSTIDEQHELVIDAMHELRRAIELGRPRAEIAPLLRSFAGLVRWHFGAESALMRESGYAGQGEHEAEHSALLTQLEAVQRDFEDGKIQPSGALATFMQVWTGRHIQAADRKFVETLRAEPGSAGCANAEPHQ